jgi:hypothetical protein
LIISSFAHSGFLFKIILPEDMKELIEKLKAEGLTEVQAFKAVEIMKDFAKSKFPLFGGAIDKLFEKYNKQQEEDFMP